MAAKRHKKHKNIISHLIISIGYETIFDYFDFLLDCQCSMFILFKKTGSFDKRCTKKSPSVLIAWGFAFSSNMNLMAGLLASPLF